MAADTPDCDRYIYPGQVRCPQLVLEFASGPREQFSELLLATLREHNPGLQHLVLPGTHHQHLNQPDTVNPIIVKFVCSGKSKL